MSDRNRLKTKIAYMKKNGYKYEAPMMAVHPARPYSHLLPPQFTLVPRTYFSNLLVEFFIFLFQEISAVC